MSLLPDFITRPAGQWLESARGTVGGITWGPSLKAAKWAVHSLFSNIEIGTLIVLDEIDGTSNIYSGNPAVGNAQEKPTNAPERLTSPPRVELVVKKNAFWMRIVLFADMGFAESYMLGEIECNDLTAFFQVRFHFLLNLILVVDSFLSHM